VLPAAGLVWALALFVYVSFPLYERLLHTTTRRPVAGLGGGAGQIALVLGFWLALMAGRLGVGALRGGVALGAVLPWGLGALIVLMVLGLDLSGSTPVFKSGLQPDRLLAIGLDEERCTGAAFCAEVCPKGVFEIDRERRLAILVRPDECVQCGACVVQCPFDALAFAAPDGSIIPPETIREMKLNMMGTRSRAPSPGIDGAHGDASA